MELENLIAKQEAEQQLRDKEIQIENGRDAMKLQEQELRLWQQEQELRLRQRERELNNERKKAEAEEQQRHLQIELTKGSWRASGSVINDTECLIKNKDKNNAKPAENSGRALWT